jgi:hypothetical protein
VEQEGGVIETEVVKSSVGSSAFECGCRVEITEIYDGKYHYSAEIVYCSRHATADEMYEVLERALDNKYLWQIEAAKADKEE